MIDKPFNKFVLTIVIVALLMGSWLLGKRQGVSERSESTDGHLGRVEAQAMIDQLQERLRNAELDLAETAEAVEVGMARTQTLRSLLNEQMQKNVSDSIDLGLYRKIENSEKARAIDVESVTWSQSEPSTLRLTLIQWMGRDRVVGELSVSLDYVGHFGVNAAESDVQKPISDELTIDLDAIAFDFRFFQTFLIPIPADLTSDGAGKSQIQLPYSVSVKITPAEDSLDTVEMQFPWSDVAQ